MKLKVAIGNRTGKFDNFKGLRFIQKEVSVDEFIDLHLKQGFCITAPHTKQRRKECVIGANWVGFDFDSGYSGEFEGYNGILYQTASSTPENPRYRFILFLDRVYTGPELEEGLRFWHSQFNTMDPSCTDCSRLWFGVTLAHYQVQSNEKDFSIDENQSVKMTTPYIYNIEGRENNTLIETNKGQTDIKVKSLEYIKSDCILFNNIDKSTHREWFSLMLQLQYIEGGKNLFLNLMKNRPNTESDTKDTWNFTKKANYKAPKCSTFCPFRDKCQNSGEYIWQMKVSDLSILREEEIKYQSIEEAEAELENTLIQELSNNTPEIVIIEAQTGIGKSTKIKNIIENGNYSDIQIAFPTHELKTQNKIGYELPALPKSIPNYSIIESYWNSGFNTLELFKNKELKNNPEYIEWLKNLKEFNSAPIVSTTHSRVITSRKFKTINIFDEDPIQSLISIETISEKELLSNMFYISAKFDGLKNLVKSLTELKVGTIIDTPEVVIDIEFLEEELKNKEIFLPILKLIESKKVMVVDDGNKDRHYTFCIVKSLPSNKKSIILSASPAIDIYKLIYPNVRVIKIKPVRPIGSIEQDVKKGYSLTQSAKSEDEIKKIIDSHPEYVIITHRKINCKKDAYFGNLRGLNSMEGKNLLVIGTQHLPSTIIQLISSSIGIRKSISDVIGVKEVKFNGYKFRFPTFDDPEIRAIHLNYINSELVQAIGRARALRNDVKVLVFSSLPLKETTKFIGYN